MADNQSANWSARVSVALLVLRIACGIAFLFHGSQILFGAFGGPGPSGFAHFLKAPDIVGYLIGLAQFVGALAILLGAFTRIGSIFIIIVMLGAIFLVHISKGFDVSKGGYEYALTQLLIAVSLLLTGGGKYSLRDLLPEKFRPW